MNGLLETFVVAAAGGNLTAIGIFAELPNRSRCVVCGKYFMKKYASLKVEQAGLLTVDSNSLPHFEMSGGEFCGNAARSAAVILSKRLLKNDVHFTMSGFKGIVKSRVSQISDRRYDVLSIFPKMKWKVCRVAEQVCLVDLGGIVHVVIFGDFPVSDYREKHRAYMEELSLTDRDAVGVTWAEELSGQVSINPVVWVKELDTFFHETSCGSGSIAAALARGFSSVVLQPSGEGISVHLGGSFISLRSSMEVVHHEQYYL